MGTVIGVFQYPNGSPVSGVAQFLLTAPGFYTGTACVCPSLVSVPISGGSFTATVIFNDLIGGAYQLTVKALQSAYGGQAWNGLYTFTGTTTINITKVLP